MRLRLPTSLALIGAAALALAACGTSSGDGGAKTAAAPQATKLSFAVFPSIQRLVPRVDVQGMPTSIDLVAARGEREGAQLVVWDAKPKEQARVVLRSAGLTGPAKASIPAANVHTYVEQVMHVEHGSPAGRSGEYTDPLIPVDARPVTISGDARLLSWVDVDVPVTATPGRYTGTVQILRASKDGEPVEGVEPLASVPLAVTVRRASIPHLPTLGSSIGFDANQLLRFEDVEPGSAKVRDLTETYASTLAAARLSIADVGAMPPGTLPGHQGQPDDGAYLKRVFDERGVASVRIPFYMDHPFADPLGADRPKAVAYLRNAAKWARANGWLARSYVYAIDEPDASRAGEVRELHELVHEADPALKLLVTTESSAREFQGNVDIWVPNISAARFHPADVARERAAGRDTWWYPSITSWQPYPTLYIDDLRPAPRALGWLAYRNGVRGFLYWSATHWHEVKDPYREPDTFHQDEIVGNGDGTLLYPGGPIGLPDTVVPSVRLFQLRDGIEDHDLLTLARCAPAAPRATVNRALATVAPSMTSFGASGQQVADLRRALFDAIDACR